MCVCVWPYPNGKTTAHQLLFDYGCRGSGTMSVIRYYTVRDITRFYTHIPHMHKKTHTLCQSWTDKWKKKEKKRETFID